MSLQGTNKTKKKMTPIELITILLDGPFLNRTQRLDSLMILIEHYRVTGHVPASQNELVLVN